MERRGPSAVAEAALVHAPVPARDAARAVARAALIGVAGRVALGLVKTILRRRIGPRAVADAVLTLDPLRWAAVLAGWAAFPALCAVLAAAVRRTLHILDRLRHRSVASTAATRPLPPVVEHAVTCAAGALSGVPVLVMNRQTRTELGLYLASRALHGTIVAHVHPRLPAPLRDFEHFELVNLGATAFPILYALVFEPAALSRGYLAFLQRCTLYSRAALNAQADGQRCILTPAAHELATRYGIPIPRTPDAITALGARILHPHDTDYSLAAAKWAARHFVGFCLPLYVPLKLAATAVFKGRKLLKDPAPTLLGALRSAMWSSAFLTLYCFGPVRIMSANSSTFKLQSGAVVSLAAGLWCTPIGLCEPRGRRLDLALYCNMHAIRVCRLLLHRRGFLPRPAAWELWALYGAAMAGIFHQWVHARETMHPNLRSGLKWLIGGPTAVVPAMELPQTEMQTALEDIVDDVEAAAEENLEAVIVDQ